MKDQEEINRFSKALVDTLDSHYTKEQQKEITQKLTAKTDKDRPAFINMMLKKMLDDGEDPYHVLDLLYKYEDKVTDEQYQEIQDMADDYIADNEDDLK